MDKKEQTEEVKVRLYQLTRQFVYKYQHRYYKQFNPEVEDLEDLISEFYVSFLTPKSREKGKEQSLLDKFDPSVTTLEYLVKIAVQRKLIDYSRQHPGTNISIDSKVDEFGDCILKGFSLVDNTPESIDDRQFSQRDVNEMKLAFYSLSEYSKTCFNKQFQECKSALAPQYQKVFQSILDDYDKFSSKAQEFVQLFVDVLDEFGKQISCPLQQVTDKTAVVFVNGEFINFDRFTGKPRNKAVLKELVSSDFFRRLNSDVSIIKPQLSREGIKERYS